VLVGWRSAGPKTLLRGARSEEIGQIGLKPALISMPTMEKVLERKCRYSGPRSLFQSKTDEKYEE